MVRACLSSDRGWFEEQRENWGMLFAVQFLRDLKQTYNMTQDERGYRYFQRPAKNVNRGAFVLPLLLIIGVLVAGSAKASSCGPGGSESLLASDDEAAIRALEDRFAAALNAGDVDAIMRNYIADQGLVVFDVVPRKQYRGADAYRKDWMDFFTHFKGTPKITITDLEITVDANLGFSHSIQHIVGTDMQGHSVDRTVRVTDGYRKIGGQWLIVLEHVSVPVDLATGKAELTPKP
jgi:ketosteroid isomerase-like protein